MKNLILIFIVFFAGGKLFAQNTASTTAPVNISLVRGLTISTTGSGTLDFGEMVVTGSTQTASKSNENGQKFLVTGQPNRTTTVTYDGTVGMNNDAWVAINGGTQGTLTFTPHTADQTGKEASYTNPQAIASGNAVNLVNDSGIGKLYIWVGGEISVPGDQPQGDYVGTFNIGVAY